MSIPPKGVPTGKDDADPTGMRDVLSSLPEPGPMPSDLADRICASLEREQGLRADPQPWDADARVHDVPSERVHRRPQQWILAAAAVLAVGVIGTVVFDQVLSSQPSSDSVAANVPSPQREESGDEGAADGGESENDSADAGEVESSVEEEANPQLSESAEQGTDEDSAGSDSTGVNPLARAALQAVDDDVFAVGAKSLLGVASGQTEDDSPGQTFDPALDLSDIQPLNEDELDSCVSATGLESSDRSWAGAPTSINGADIVIVGSTGPEDPEQAWALDETCPDDSAASVLKGPVSLP